MNRTLPTLLAGLLLATSALSAQPPAPPDTAGWNAPRALELIRRAQALRTRSVQDTALVSYRADARAYVYFYLDRRDTGERNLVKTDQLALEVLWRAPDLAKQRIVGWRDQKSLPTNIHYHIDHLAVVMENFGDEIRIGDGDEVSGVPHPAAPQGERFYDYRLGDSLTLRLSGAPEPVRVYELEVRPRDLRRPGFVGTLFVDQREGALVRLDFTFTPASYRDRRLDYINISLDNGLWKGRFWLPNEQRVEIRRQIPELDIPAGSVIRGRMRIGDYRFNEPIAMAEFVGPPVVLAPARQRQEFRFEEEVHQELREEGIGPAVELSEVRRQALALARQQALSNLRGLRLRLPAASEVLRYNRAEGLALGAGLARPLAPSLTGRLTGGWAFGPGHALGQARLDWERGPLRLGLAGYVNQPRDVGVGPAASGAANTLAALVAGRDYTDLYYAGGAELSARWQAAPAWDLFARARVEDHSSAAPTADFSLLEGGSSFRPVRTVEEGPARSLALGARRTAQAGVERWWEGELHATVGDFAVGMACYPESCPLRLDEDGYLRADAALRLGRSWAPAATLLEGELAGGIGAGTLPRQALFLLGGRGTVPGYRFRDFGGDRFLLARATLSAELWRPWLRGRLLGAAGWAGAGSAGEPALRLWGAAPSANLRPSVGIGAGLFYDILRVELHRGLGENAIWEAVVETRRGFWDFL